MKLRHLALCLAVYPLHYAPASAQSSCIPTAVEVEGAPFFEAWVDPINGDDSSALSSNPGNPASIATAKAARFKTIQAAIDALHAQVRNANPACPATDPNCEILEPGLVHLGPGIYDPSTQSFPIRMRNGVNVVGGNARHCVLRTGAAQPIVFTPTREPATCEQGSRSSLSIIVDYSSSYDGDRANYSELVQGVTFQGSDIQVSCDSEFTPVTGRISNCLFDMLNYSTLPGPYFGILLVHKYNQFTDSYVNYQFDIIHNTFIQGWRPTPTVKVTARPESVGLCDVSDPLYPETTGLHYVGKTTVVNNLFRCLTQDSADVRTATLGIPATDGRASQDGEPERDCNYLLETQSDSFCSDVAEPLVNAPGADDDPAFVGEMLTAKLGLGLKVGRDWRVLPDSVVVDKGVGTGADGTLVVFDEIGIGNFVPRPYTEPSVTDCRLSAIDSFAFDGEGYGNRRVIGAHPDLGCDEFERLIGAGYGPESIVIPATPVATCYPITTGPGLTGGANAIYNIVANPGTLWFRRTNVNCPSTGFSAPPGALVPPSAVGADLFWASFMNLSAGPFTATAQTYTPIEGSAPHSFGLRVDPSTNVGKYRNVQARVGGVWSNLQTYMD